MQIFTGRYNVSLDGKGRLAIPAKLRQIATADGSEELFVTVGTHKNLELLSMSGFQNKSSLYRSSKAIEEEDELLAKREFFSSTTLVKPDKQGRILVPPQLREHAGIDGEAIVMGIGDKMEIWNEEEYEKYRREARKAKEAKAKAKAKRQEAEGGGSSSQTGSSG